MSMPVTLESRTRVPWHHRAAARLAVGAARLLVRLRPRRLRRVLESVRRGARPADAATAGAARAAVVAVSRRCAAQQCLQRSVATALLCRMWGVWPDWCTGVRTQPFRAHAWVEADGQAVGEREDVTLYRTMMEVRAHDRR
ncbi:lasso peptide biosynthesis B2 protein [Streptomyces sp. NEAU-S77]|uniref:lasso peptide biosynthesis B2 protein n=1 Tax=Streptomyces sp. NEAU-S77 TaxID=3411033 RepID=UPI003BA3E18E